MLVTCCLDGNGLQPKFRWFRMESYFTKGGFMSRILALPPRGGKTVISKAHSVYTVRDKIFACAIFQGDTFPKRMDHNGVTNSPYLYDRGLVEGYYAQKSDDGRVKFLCQHCDIKELISLDNLTKVILPSEGFVKLNKEEFTDILSYGRHFTNCNGALLNSRLKPVTIDSDLFECWGLPSTDGQDFSLLFVLDHSTLTIANAFANYSVLQSGWRWDGVVYLALEGNCSAPSSFINPRSLDSTPKTNNPLPSENAQKRLYQLYDSKLQACKSKDVDELKKLNKSKGLDRLPTAGEWVTMALDKSVKLPSSLSLSNSEVDDAQRDLSIWKGLWDKGTSRLADQFKVNQTSDNVIWRDSDGKMNSVRVNLFKWLLNLEGWYFVDSLLSFLYSTTGGRAIGGISTDLLTALSETTYSDCALLYPVQKKDSLTENFDLSGFTNGELVRNESDAFYGLGDTNLTLSFTSRESGRSEEIALSHSEIIDGEQFFVIDVPGRKVSVFKNTDDVSNVSYTGNQKVEDVNKENILAFITN